MSVAVDDGHPEHEPAARGAGSLPQHGRPPPAAAAARGRRRAARRRHAGLDVHVTLLQDAQAVTAGEGERWRASVDEVKSSRTAM